MDHLEKVKLRDDQCFEVEEQDLFCGILEAAPPGVGISALDFNSQTE
jgi:hypothetical protein